MQDIEEEWVMAKYITPAVTPLNNDGTLDVEGAEKLYELSLIHI